MDYLFIYSHKPYISNFAVSATCAYYPMKEKEIKDLIDAGDTFYIGVRYNKDNENYSVYLATSSKEYIDSIHVWDGEREKVFSDPRRILVWAKRLGVVGVCFDPILF
jgi:poly(A) polymerase Pap1